MPAPHVIVCEKSGRWAVAFRRALGKQSALVKETRSLPGCGRELAARPASVVAVEVAEGNLEAVIAALTDWSRRFPVSRVMSLMDPQLAGSELVLREAGAMIVLHSPRELAAAMQFVHRHLAQAPAADLPLEQAAWASLPWANWATKPA